MRLADPSADVKGVAWAQGGGFAIIPEWILYNPDLSDRAVRLFAILTRYADRNGHDAFPGRRRLAERLRCAESTLDVALNELKAVKAVSIVPRKRADGSATSNEYVLNPMPREGCTDTPVQVPSPVGTHELKPLTESAKSLTLPGPSSATPPQVSSDLQKVYDHWRTKRGRTRSNYERIAPQRKQKILSRLREFTADELCTAIDNLAYDPWPDRAMHDDLTVIFRSQCQVEKFLDLADTVSNLDKRPNGSIPVPDWRAVIAAHDNGQVAYA